MNTTCQNCKKEFIIDEQDQAFYKKMQVPMPTFCWICRAQRRFNFRNDRSLYRRKSDFSGEEIFAMYPPESYVKVYERDIWFSDKWDPMSFGRDVDFSRPFFAQLFDLLKVVPVYNLSTQYGVNSDYSNNFTGFKNCYLCFNGNITENSAYSNGTNNSKECFDCSYIDKSELCYEGFFLNGCSRTMFSSYCESSFNLFFCKNLVGCNDCFGCVNLRNKQYFIFNKQYAKEEYQEKIKEFQFYSYRALEDLRKKVQEFWLQFPNKYMSGLKNVNVKGEYLYNSKNVIDSYQVREGENIRYCQNLLIPKNKDCYDYSVWGGDNELMYEVATSGDGANNLKFCMECWPGMRDSQYSLYCGSSTNLFGCVGLRAKKYCILNKQYSKEEYEALVPKIIQHMNDMPYTDKKGRVYTYGEFFPIELSPFPYNATMAQEFFTLTKDQAMEEGYFWRDSEEKNIAATKSAQELPDSIQEVQDSIFQELIGCAHQGQCNQQCTKVFKVIPQEVAFYKSMNIALPRLCPNCRYYERIGQRNPLQTWKRKCQCANSSHHFHGQTPCPKEFETAYAPERKEIVYCEKCYQAELA